MKKLTGILMAVCLTAALIAGCGQKAGRENTQTTDNQSAAQTESQTAGNQRETGDLSGDEVSAAQHCILLAGKNGTWLLADRYNGTVFTTSIPNDLKDNDGKKITSEILKAGDYVDVYGDGIMLESYPGQYPGVSKMVVTGEGTADEVKQYQNVIDMVFAEPDTSTVPTVGVVYSSSLGQTMSLMSGPGNSTWTAPSGDSETDSSEDNTVTACGSAVMQWENLEKMSMDAGKTDFTISCDLTPTKVTVRRWNSDKYPASVDDDLDALAEEVNVEKSADGEFVVRDVEPGEVVVIDKDGIKSDKSLCLKPEEQARCVFEYIYFARPDSKIDGMGVYESRINAGRILAKTHPVDADLVVGVPESGNPAALGFSLESGIPYGNAFIKNNYVGRTFIKPKQAQRESSVKVKLNVLKEAVAGKRVVMIDDSIVRGTTSARIVSLLKNSGAKEVHVRISSPPFKHPCYFGTDIPSEDQLIATGKTVDEICKIIGADSLGYLEVDRLSEMICGGTGFCDACFTGNYPMDPPTRDIRGEMG